MQRGTDRGGRGGQPNPYEYRETQLEPLVPGFGEEDVFTPPLVFGAEAELFTIEVTEAGGLPDDVIAHAHELGLVANALDASCGGGGERSAVTGALVAEALAWGDLSIALAILSLVIQRILHQGLEGRPQHLKALSSKPLFESRHQRFPTISDSSPSSVSSEIWWLARAST